MNILPINLSDEKVQHAIEALMYDHFQEIVVDMDEEDLAPDWEKYGQLEKQGQLFSFGAFSENTLVGYVVNYTSTLLHYKDVLVAFNDAVFIHKDFREGSLGLKLIALSEQQAKSLGASMFRWHVKPSSTLEKIFLKKKYKLRESIYGKEL